MFIYPKFDSKVDLGLRIGGPGLANCLFVFARALIFSRINNIQIINPTWQRFGLGPYIRKEKDKRHYFNIFNPIGISGIKKYIILNTSKKLKEPSVVNQCIAGMDQSGVIIFEGLKNYFADIHDYNELLKKEFIKIIKQKYLQSINNFNFKKSVGVHIRLGDFSESIRTPLSWYKEMIYAINDRLNHKAKILLFSDGKDNELQELLSINNVERVYFGSAISDIIAISNCKLIIGSDSTFSGWGAFLGHVPSIFYKKHYGNIFIDGTCEAVIQNPHEIPDILFQKIIQ